MKNRGLIIFLIVILSLLAISIVGGLIVALSGRGRFGFFNIGSSTISETLIYDKSYETPFKNINIDSDAGDIRIKKSTTGEIKVKIYGETEQLEVDDKDNLEIKYVAKKCFGFCLNTTKSLIELTLPDDYSGEINIENKFGDSNIDEFLNANMKISHDYGNIKIDGLKDGKIKNNCGDIEIGTVNDIEVDNSYGDIKIRKVQSHLDVKASCGDIEVKDLTIDKNSSINNSMGDIDVGMTNEIRIDAHTSLGDLNIRNNSYKSDIVLKIDNSCGDIEVKN